MSEQDLSRERGIWFCKQADTLKRVFESRRINFYACNDISEARNQMFRLIQGFCEEKRTHQIGFADRVTLHELDIFRDISRLENVQVCNPFERLPDGKLSVFSDAPSASWICPMMSIIKGYPYMLIKCGKHYFPMFLSWEQMQLPWREKLYQLMDQEIGLVG